MAASRFRRQTTGCGLGCQPDKHGPNIYDTTCSAANEVNVPRRDRHLAEAGHAALAVAQVRIEIKPPRKSDIAWRIPALA